MIGIRNTRFDLSAEERNLVVPPINHEEFRIVLNAIPDNRIDYLVQTYVRDRTPAAFHSAPMLWQHIRRWLSDRARTVSISDVCPSDWGIAGSGGVGFSLSPEKFGNSFGEHSDLDLFLVSSAAFDLLAKEGRKFLSYTNMNPTRQQAQQTLEKQVSRGLLIDTKNIPADHERYPVASHLLNDASILMDKLKLEGITSKRSFIRVYHDWSAFTSQLRLNLKSLRDALARGVSTV